MYSVKPYYETNSNNGASENTSMASILPLPLLPTDVNSCDVNIKSTLEDVLSRQMLLLCRLNQLEQQLLARQNNVKCNGVALESALEAPKIAVSIDEDLVIQFNIDAVPYSLFALITSLRKGNTPVMANLHLHSSVARQPAVISRVTALKNQLARILNFTFTSSNEYLTRSQFPLRVTFIVTSATTSQPKAIFQAGKKLVEGEFQIAQAVLQLLNADPAGSESIWSVLTNAATLSSDKAVLEQLGPSIGAFNLSKSVFLLQQSSPSLLDVILWSLTVMEFKRPGGTVATALCGSQLLNSKWQSAIREFVSK